MKTKNKIIAFLILALFVFWIGKSVYSYYFLPGPFDDFAKCVSEKGAVMYGALSWCEYTRAQKAMFGKSFQYLNYVEYTEFPEKYGKIKLTPTWIINGQTYERVQSFERLAQLTNCTLP